jgi:hypothetical protein
VTRLCHESVEQLVLRAFEFGDLFEHTGPMTTHGFGVAFGLAVIFAGERGFRDQGAEPGVVGCIGEVGQLLVGDSELLPQLAQPVGYLTKPPLDRSFGHEQRLYASPATRSAWIAPQGGPIGCPVPDGR